MNYVLKGFERNKILIDRADFFVLFYFRWLYQ